MTESHFENNQGEDFSKCNAMLHTPCDEQHLLQYADGLLVPEENTAVEAHLASCARCEAFVEQCRQLDTQLEARLPHPALSRGFAARLRTLIETEPSLRLVHSAHGTKPLETEWVATWARYRRRFLWTQLPGALDKVGFALGAGLLMLVAGRAAHRYSNLVPVVSQATLSQPWTMRVVAAVTIVTLLAVAAFVAKRRLARLFAVF